MVEFPPDIDFLPGTNQPVPAVMTAEEACLYLRLDEGRSIKNAVRALNRLVDRRRITPIVVGKRRRYAKVELERFIVKEVEFQRRAS